MQTPGLFSGGFGHQTQASGTGHVKYCPLIGSDVMGKSSNCHSVIVKHHCITCMKEYENKSLEELRLEDYTAGRGGNDNAGGFIGAAKPSLFEESGSFGASTPFTGLFESTAPASTSSASSASTSGRFAFGETANTSSGLFGANNVTVGLFESTAPASTSSTSGASTSGGFAFGKSANTSSGLFGANNVTVGLFESTAPASTSSTSGASTSGGFAFGETANTSSGVFGANNVTVGLFESTAPASTSSTSGASVSGGFAFGKTANTSSGLFGANNVTVGLLESTAPANTCPVIGASTSRVFSFGETTNTYNGMFGANNETGGLFGALNNNTAFGAKPSAAFSQLATTTMTFSSMFDQLATTMTSSVFGQPKTTTTSNVFGQPVTRTTSFVFGQTTKTTSVFGEPVTTTASSVFGQPASTTASSVFGQPALTTASSVFGQPASTTASSVFGQPASTTASSVFGQPASTTASSVFGQPASTTTSSVFGQPTTTTTSRVFGHPVMTTNSRVFGEPTTKTTSSDFGPPTTTTTSRVFGQSVMTTNSRFFGQPMTTTTSSEFGLPATTITSSVLGQPVMTTNSRVFGQPMTTTTSSVFSQPTTTTTSTVFGQPVMTTNSRVFGQSSTTTTSSEFGLPATTTTSRVFGQPSTTTTSSVFGQPTTKTTFNDFGQPTTTTTSRVFGQPVMTTNSRVFGQPTTTTTSSMFGQPTTTTTSTVFGQPTTTTTSSMFGQLTTKMTSSDFGQPTTTTTSRVFGQPVMTTNSRVFGQPTTTTTSSMFGQPTTTTTSTVFGQPTTTTTSSMFGQLTTKTTSSDFGQPTTTTTSRVFGQPVMTTNSRVFGQPTTTTTSSVFGQPTTTTTSSVFGQPMTTTISSVFGLPTITTTSSVFGPPAMTTTSNVFGQLAMTTASSVVGLPVTTTASSVFGQPATTTNYGDCRLGSTSSFGKTPMEQNTPRTTCTGETPNNPPLRFHRVHSTNVRLSSDGCTARRVGSFNGVAFSSRPISVNEKVYIRIVEISHGWSGVLKLGFTTHDPTTPSHSLPIDELNLWNKPGIWIYALREIFCEEGNILYYFVNSHGDAHFGINGEDKGIFFTGVDTRSPLWSIVDVYGNCTAIQYVDPRVPNQVHRSLLSSLSEGNEGRLSAPRMTCTGETTNNLPPLSFHRVHSTNVGLSSDGSTARRVGSYFGAAFSARPIEVTEKVCIRLVEISNNWSGGLLFGITTNDPATLSHYIPNATHIHSHDLYLKRKPGYWVKDLEERFCKKDNILYYYVNSAGDFHFGINGEDKGILFTGIDTQSPLWSLVDVYGKCNAIQFADPRTLNQIPRSLQTSLSEDNEERLHGSLEALSINESLPPLRFQGQAVVPLTLHRTKGRNVQLTSDRGVVARIEADFCQGYVFTATPMRPGQTLVIQILATHPAYAGSLAIGLTSCDPMTLGPSDLPDEAEQLLDRPEYWVVRRDTAKGLRRGEELAVTLSLDGEVRLGKNGSNQMTVMHVDHTVRLWAFVDIYGATQKVRMLSSHSPQQAEPPPAPQQLRVLTGSAAPFDTRAGTQQPCNQSLQHIANRPSSSCIQVLPTNQQPTSVQHPRTDAQCSSSQSSQKEQVIQPNIVMNEHSNPPLRLANEGLDDLTGTECTICCENPVNSVLYMCGHMCMCYQCALEQWQGQGTGKCPLCRATIKDVIRTYKS